MGVLSLLLPGRCAGCGRPGSSVCDACLASLVHLAPPVCERCGAPGAWPVKRCAECAGRRLAFRGARAAIAYEGIARSIVSAWKESGRRDIAPLLSRVVAEVIPPPEVDLLTFVPGDRERSLARGHVPAAGLALALGRIWGIEVLPLLARRVPARRQASLPLAERRRNVRDVFGARGPAPARVGLVDDVYTTGSTVSACATELRRAGARTIDVVCLARAIR